MDEENETDREESEQQTTDEENETDMEENEQQTTDEDGEGISDEESQEIGSSGSPIKKSKKGNYFDQHRC